MYRLLRPLLFALPPEASHRLAMAALRLGGPLLPRPWSDPRLEVRVLGLRFPNPVGLAAGFDKYAEAAGLWERLGFGFAELGTFTALPQGGNERPRVWRYPKARALVNRFGFNNPGAEAAAARLRRLKEAGRWPAHPLGINIGKSKAAPLEAAEEDYLRSLRAFEGLGDYVAVNVSSPNTPGLRSLQRARPVGRLVRAMVRELRRQKVPLFVKFSPDLGSRELLDSCDAALGAGADGLILGNTTLSRNGLGPGPHPEGGLSGGPLREMADQALERVARHTRGRVPLIGVGGIFSAGDARRKLALGATLVQVYTGFIYQGPFLPRRICRGLGRI